jgi:ATP-dependent helicase HrpA
VSASKRLIERRRAARYTLTFPEALPVAQARPAILEALRAHRVIVVCGDTGSGKTTQLPKLCLEAGRGVLGMIGHTQPRRIAAHAVAARLAEELGVAVGGMIGLQVRFTDRTDPAASIKVMTDGILLNEIRRDRWLAAYDTLIIDEAHERSLNIDFILGYLKRIEHRRPDLKIIITSATIDPERFARHFGGAPIVRVEGRSYPVEIRFCAPPGDQELAESVTAAANELALEMAVAGGARDMLVFLPGERWIRDTAQALARGGPKGHEVLPLYARLTAAGQQRIFRPGKAPRIVLATNVAETSLTVPRIRAVIDSGLARIGRYSTRHRVQGLGVEPIARANAIQRAGRCGRIAPGVCVRLYSEQDFESRPQFTEPEIQRTSLASVILRLEAWRLGHIDDFPFVDAPPVKAVNDAYQLLHLLGAMDAERALTADGALMARLPVDPRVARLLVVANRNGALREGLVIAAALSTVDPRDHSPHDPDAARRQHEKFADPRSDFATFLNLWQAYRRERRVGERAFRAWCKAHYLSASRLKEWHDVHTQLRELALALGWRTQRAPADHKAQHQAVLAAFIDFIAEHAEGTTYRGMRDSRAALYPGTPLAKKHPRWLVAAERIATERQYLRTVAQVNPRWAIHVAPHLIKRSHLEPFWDARRGQVTAREIVTLFGLTLASEQRVDFGPIDPVLARQMFINDALVADDLGADSAALPPFLERNRQLRTAVLDAEAKLRKADLFIGAPGLAKFYEGRLPADVRDRSTLLRWCKNAVHRDRLLMAAADAMSREPTELTDELYPSCLEIAGQRLALTYRFEPGTAEDGLELTLPHALLGAVRAQDLEWLVPGWLAEKVTAMLRALPKDLRRPLVPLPDTAAALLDRLAARAGRQPLAIALCEVLAESRNVLLPARAFDAAAMPDHLRMQVVVVAADGRELARGRDLRALQRELAAGDPPIVAAERGGRESRWSRTGVTQWDFGDLPEAVIVPQQPQDLRLYPSLVDEQGRVDLRLMPPGPIAEARHRHGVRRLLLKCLPQQTALIRGDTQAQRDLILSYHGIGSSDALVDDLLCASAESSFALQPVIRTRDAFDACLRAGRSELVPAADQLRHLLREILSLYRQIRRELDASKPSHEHARTDIVAQVERLAAPCFLTDTPPEWRKHLPRYLKAVQQRWQKLAQRPSQDAQIQARVQQAADRLERWRETLPAGWPWPAAMIRYRWMLEELRVSLFAQPLGTAVPVSEKRLEEQWRHATADTSAARHSGASSAAG